MHETLTAPAVRVLGALIEKEFTTPEYYPLTLNALINACNQKSNRDPVVAYDGRTVAEALEELKVPGLVHIVMGGDSRVPKYRQYFGEAYDLTPSEVAILCELMLRGPQTVAELRGRTERMGNRQEQDQVEATLEGLANREEPLVVKLPRQPGRKEHRYAHLLAGEPIIEDVEITPRLGPAATAARAESERITRLEEEVQSLRQTVEELQQQFAEFKQQFE
ncbi:MAG: YceH family protein [Armatimonadota bacterium]